MSSRLVLALFLSTGLIFSACSPASSGGGSSSGDSDADTGGASTGDGTSDTGGTGETTGDAGGTGGVTTGDTTGEPQKEAEWTVDPNVPDELGGKTMQHFAGYLDAEGLRVYVCGEGGIFRIRAGTTWRDQNLSVSETIRGCHAVNDDLMAAVGDQGRVWKWQGTENWQNFDLIDAPNLRDVWVSSLGTLRVVGVQGTIQRLDTAVWTDESLPEVEATLESLHGVGEELYAVGDQALLHFDGTEWTSETLPEDPPGTPAANLGFSAKDVWAADAANVWAVGDKGKIAYSKGSGAWEYQDSQWYGGTPFNTVWGFNESDVFVLGAVGKARRWNGQEWSPIEVKTPKKTHLGDLWPTDQVVPPEGPGISYIGAFAKDPVTLWFFTSEGLLIQFGDDYIL